MGSHVSPLVAEARRASGSVEIVDMVGVVGGGGGREGERVPSNLRSVIF